MNKEQPIKEINFEEVQKMFLGDPVSILHAWAMRYCNAEQLKVLADKLQRRTPIQSGEERLWLNMKDAPKDGTYILLYDDNDVHKAAWLDDSDGYGKTRYYCWAIADTWGDEQGGYSQVDNPKGWQPLPKPPNGEQKSNTGEERLFTLKEALEIWDDSILNKGKSQLQYFKEKFNIEDTAIYTGNSFK